MSSLLLPHVGAFTQLDVLSLQLLAHAIVPELKSELYSMHLPLNGPRFVVSQLSPRSIAVFPHLGLSVQLEVSSWQFVHFKLPPEKDKLYFAHVFMMPNFVPSQDSPGSISLLPHVGSDMQPDVSSRQLLVQFKVPPIKLVNCVQLLIEPKEFLSHNSPGWFMMLSPQTGFSMHADVLTVMPSLFLKPLSIPMRFFDFTLKKY